MDNLVDKLVAYFFTLLIFASIAWYAFLIFYVGFKGGVEVFAMTRRFSDRAEDDPAG
jgi:hypothetical protein